MPHIALPLLKPYISERIPDASIICIDLNHDFFASLFSGSFHKAINDYRSSFGSSDIQSSIRAALEFSKRSDATFKQWEAQWPGHRLSYRNYDAPQNRRNCDEVYYYASHKGPFDDVINSCLARIMLEPDYIGINISVEDQILPAFRLAFLIRQHWGKAVVLVGGSLIPRIHKYFRDTKLRKLYDYAVLKEGEEPLVEIIGGRMSGSKIDSRIFPSNGQADLNIYTGKTIELESAPFPDFSDYDYQHYIAPAPILPILATRKCYWSKCRFCTIHASWDSEQRCRTAESVIGELKLRSMEQDVHFFRFVDEAIPPPLLHEISKEIIKESLSVFFEVYAIPEIRLRKDELISDAARAGLRQVFFGLESVSKKHLKIMGKQINDVDHYKELFAMLANRGIHNYTFSLFGYPSTDVNDEAATVDYLKNEKNIHTVTIGSFIPVEGSPFVGDIGSENLIHSGEMTEDYSEIIINGEQKRVPDLGAEIARKAQDAIYGERTDLALTTTLHDEEKLVLSTLYGGSFAQCADLSAYRDALTQQAKAIAYKERVLRGIAKDEKLGI
jgi:radical SAM superfamily enzyme YgiQ (UPF0313 family)